MYLILLMNTFLTCYKGVMFNNHLSIPVYFSLPDHNTLNKSGRCLSFHNPNLGFTPVSNGPLV